MRAQTFHQDQRAATAFHSLDIPTRKAPVEFGATQSRKAASFSDWRRQRLGCPTAPFEAAAVFIGQFHL
jgi:hypothetical protein